MRHLIAHLCGQRRTIYCLRSNFVTDNVDELEQVWIVLHLLDPAESLRVARALGIETDDPEQAFRRTLDLVQAIMLDDENATPLINAIEANTPYFWDGMVYQSECRIEKGMRRARTKQ